MSPRSPSASTTQPSLVGRHAEQEDIASRLDAARSGRGSTLLVHGEAGIGKTALLDWARAQHPGRTLWACGIEAEVNLPFAVLQAILEPILLLREGLPAPQLDALLGALALGPAAPGDRFAVCLATLSLLRAAALEGPLLVVVDDLQWADPASSECLGFAARRLAESRVAVLFAWRDGEGTPPPLDTALHLTPVERTAARAIVTATNLGLSTAACETVVDAAAGNPLALREIAASLTADERAGRAPLPEPLRPGGRLAEILRRRVERLADATQTAILVAAAANGGELATIRAACRALGVAGDAITPAQDEGLVGIARGRLTFAHPLVRTAAYHLATPSRRRDAHRALARIVPPERAAWHLADAAAGPDEEVAAALDAAGRQAQARRGYLEAAAAHDRAAHSSIDPSRRARRLLRSSAASISAGHLDRALSAIDAALDADPALCADIRVVQTRAILLMGMARIGEALRAMDQTLSTAAVAENPSLAAVIGADAALAEMIAGDYDRARERAERAAAAIGANDPPSVRAQVLVSLAAARAYRGDPASARELITNIDPLLRDLDPLDWTIGMRTHSLAIDVWLAVEDPERALALSRWILDHVESAGAMSARANPLSLAANAALQFGDWLAASRAATETIATAEDTGSTDALVRGLLTRARLAAATGQDGEAREALARARNLSAGAPQGMADVWHRATQGFLELSLGHAAAAIEVLEPLDSIVGTRITLIHPTAIPWRPDLVEAFVLANRLHDARRAAAALTDEAAIAGLAGGLALAARCRGLIRAEGFDDDFAEALALQPPATAPFEHARTLLVYGERLHRARRRARARTVLKEAICLFRSLDARPWCTRAETALRVASPGRRPGGTGSAEALTAQELRVATVLAAGGTIREAAVGLHLSPKTVDAHLRQVYAKLAIRSRAELAQIAVDRGWLPSRR